MKGGSAAAKATGVAFAEALAHVAAAALSAVVASVRHAPNWIFGWRKKSGFLALLRRAARGGSCVWVLSVDLWEALTLNYRWTSASVGLC